MVITTSPLQVKIRYEHIVKVEFLGADDSEEDDFY